MRVRTALSSTLVVLLLSSGAWAEAGGQGGREAGKSHPGLRGSMAGAARGGQKFSRRESIRARTPGAFAPSPRYRTHAPGFNPGYGFGSHRYRGYGYSPYLAQSYGWPGFNFGSPHAYSPYSWNSPYSNYRYFYDLYYDEAQRSKQEADEFEASLAREGKLTGPEKAGAFATDFLPLAPRDVMLSVDGQEHQPSASGAPLVLGSGRHTVRIAARPSTSGETPRHDKQRN